MRSHLHGEFCRQENRLCTSKLTSQLASSAFGSTAARKGGHQAATYTNACGGLSLVCVIAIFPQVLTGLFSLGHKALVIFCRGVEPINRLKSALSPLVMLSLEGSSAPPIPDCQGRVGGLWHHRRGPSPWAFIWLWCSLNAANRRGYPPSWTSMGLRRSLILLVV